MHHFIKVEKNVTRVQETQLTHPTPWTRLITNRNNQMPRTGDCMEMDYHRLIGASIMVSEPIHQEIIYTQYEMQVYLCSEVKTLGRKTRES